MAEDVREVLQRRFGRRTLLRGGVLGGVGLATAAVIGCDDDDDDDDDDSATTPPAAGGGTGGGSTTAPSGGGSTTEPAKSAKLIYGNRSHPPSLDPDSTAATSESFWGIYDAPTRLTPEWEVDLHLAKSLELNPDDQTEWIMSVKDSEWSDGTKLTAEDVKFSYEYYSDPDNKSRLISRVGTFESARIIDEQTVAIKTKGTGDPILPRRMSFVLIKPKHIFDDPSKGLAFQSSTPVGSGAYTVTNYVGDSMIGLTESASSWHGNSGFTEVDIPLIAESTTRMSAFQTGDVDFNEGVAIAEVERVRGFDNVELGIPNSISQRGWDIPYFEGPTADVRVRKAINHAINAQEQVDVLLGGLSKIMDGQMLTEFTFGYNPNLKPHGYDPDEARRLLADAGFPNGFSIPIESHVTSFPEQRPWLEATLGDLTAIGLDTPANVIELNVWRDGLYGRRERPGIHYSPWSAFAAEASFAMQWYVKENAGKFYDNADFESAYNAALVEFDDEKRRADYAAATEAMFDDPPSAWVFYSVSPHAWRSDVVKGHVARLNPDAVFDEMVPA
jgi:peptide/nickel transport system substrate-binding protein